MTPAVRLDKYLVEQGMVSSREKAQQLIQQHAVSINGQIKHKPATLVLESDVVIILENTLKFVSRGGYKLERALLKMSIDLTNKTVLDVGASTGGFTDCCLQYGASHVTAIDVGNGQLDKKLAEHPKVNQFEGMDIRDTEVDRINGPFDMLVADLSFISLEKVLEHLNTFLKPNGELLVLVKPQFEQDSRKSFKGGIIKDEKIRQKAFEKIKRFGESVGLTYQGQCETLIAENEQKNIEAILHFKKK